MHDSFSLDFTDSLFDSWSFRRVASRFWLAQSDVGILELDTSGSVRYFPAQGIDPSWFESVVRFTWLPFLLPFRGIQVLHASAVLHLASEAVVAFCGVSEAGKSTLAFGLGQRQGWQQVADDSLGFRVGSERDITLTELPAAVRLRPQSAEHYHTEAFGYARLPWPQGEMRLDRVYLLEPRPEAEEPTIQHVVPHDAYLAVLGQAFWLTDVMTGENRRLYTDYLELTRQVLVFRLSYPRSLAALDAVLDAVEKHCSED